MLRVLHDAGLAARWRAIGQTLTVSDDDLAGFDARFSGDPSLCLLQVVDSWLHGETRLPDPPSWWLLVWAVADPQGGGTVNEGMRIAAMFKGVYVCVCVMSTGTGGVGSLNTGHAFSLLLQLKVDCPCLFLHAHMPKRPHPLYCVSDYIIILGLFCVENNYFVLKYIVQV